VSRNVGRRPRWQLGLAASVVLVDAVAGFVVFGERWGLVLWVATAATALAAPAKWRVGVAVAGVAVAVALVVVPFGVGAAAEDLILTSYFVVIAGLTVGA
jgi:hypothetical protein